MKRDTKTAKNRLDKDETIPYIDPEAKISPLIKQVSGAMTVKDIFEKAQWQDVAAELAKEYDADKDLTGYREVFNTVRAMTPTKTEMTLTLERIIVFDEPVVDVSGLMDGNSWSIMFIPWSECMGMPLDERCLDVMSPAEIAAHILYEITWFGFTEDKIKAEAEKIKMEDSELATGYDAEKILLMI